MTAPQISKTDDGRYDALKAGMPTPMAARVRVPKACIGTNARRGYRIKGLLADGDVMAIVGHPGSGKSTAAPDLAYGAAQGRHVFGLRTKPCKVLYATAEDFTGMQQRIAALYLKHGDAPNFELVDIGNLRDKPIAKDMLDYITEAKPGLVVIDTIGAAFAGLEENSSGDMGLVVAFARLIAKTGAAVILIHHIAKAGDGSPRGHSVLNGTLDACLLITMEADGICRGKLTKNRNGPCDLDIAFRIGSAELGHDEDGDTITAPIAEALAAQDRPPHMTPTEKAALMAFRQSDAGNGGLTLADWQAVCISRGVTSATKPRDQQRISKLAINGLTEKGVVTFNAGDKLYHLKDRKVVSAAVEDFHALGPKPGDLHALLH